MNVLCELLLLISRCESPMKGKTINHVENNKNWMNLLRLALKLDYKSTSKILSEIYKDDQRISKLAKKIYKL